MTPTQLALLSGYLLGVCSTLLLIGLLRSAKDSPMLPEDADDQAEMRLAEQGYRHDIESNDPVLREWAEIRLPVLEQEIEEMERTNAS